MTTTEGLTIGEAAEALGVSKQTLRLVLTRPDRKARILRAYRTTRKGLRTVEIVPADLMDELRETPLPHQKQVGPLHPDLTEAAPSADLQSGNSSPDADVADNPLLADSGLPTHGIPLSSEAAVSALLTDVPRSPPISAAENAAESGEADGAPGAGSPVAPAPMTATKDTRPTPFAAEVDALLGGSGGRTGEAMLVAATYERLLAEKENRLGDLRDALSAERENSRRLAEALAREQDMRQTAALPASAPAAIGAPPRRGFWARLFGLD